MTMSDWKKLIATTKRKAQSEFDKCQNEHDLIVARNHLIGRNSPILQYFKNSKPSEKHLLQKSLQELIVTVNKQFETIKIRFKQKPITFLDDFLPYDQVITIDDKFYVPLFNQLPQFDLPNQLNNPLDLVIALVHKFCQKIGWKFVFSNDVVDAQDNFTLLNIDPDHPAANQQDCFYLHNLRQVLRTHTTTMSVQQLCDFAQNHQPRFVYTIGNVYRNDTDDNTHLPQFTQFDALLISKKLSLAQLKGVLIQFCQFVFENKVLYRFRNSYFPFTEPSLEMDVVCTFCHQKGCDVCAHSGWIELLGAGIISPEVLQRCQITNDIIALALGIGIERIVMLKYKIRDIRLLYNKSQTHSLSEYNV